MCEGVLSTGFIHLKNLSTAIPDCPVAAPHFYQLGLLKAGKESTVCGSVPWMNRAQTNESSFRMSKSKTRRIPRQYAQKER